MAVDHIRYDILVQQALRGMVRNVLSDTVKKGLPGDHHFFVTFDTTADGVRLSDRLREQYPEEMTIVLQHQFWDLKVTEDQLEVGLSFGGIAEKLVVPFAAIKAFADPSVQFTLQFETLTEEADEAEPIDDQKKDEQPQSGRRGGGSGRPRPAPAPVTQSDESAGDKPDAGAKPDAGEKAGAEVVRLDRFRKK
jgi:hypothetical protein